MKLRYLAIALILLAAFASDSWGQSKQPSKPQSPAQQQQAAPDQRGTENSPVVVKVLPAQENENKTRDDAREHDEKRKFDTDTLWLSKVTVALILFQVLIFAAQAYFLWGTLTATAGAAKAATDTATSLMRAERPHMIVDKMKVTGVRSGPTAEGFVKLLLDFHVMNFGRTPAFPKVMSLQLRFEDTLSVGVPYGAPQQMTGVTAPGRAYATEWPTETLAPVALVQPFIDGTANMFVVGYFRYEDVFKIAHETAFAYRLVFDDGADSSKHFDAINNAAYWRYT